MQQVEVKTVAEQLVDIVRDRILDGTISTEVPIRQDALAKELNVSKIPLREALARLQRDGLVSSRANYGFFVKPLSWQEAEEIYELRRKLEPETVIQASKQATDEDKTYARQCLDRLNQISEGQSHDVGTNNRAFHLALIRPSCQQITTDLLSRLYYLADRYVAKHLENTKRYPRAESEHEAILEAWLTQQDERLGSLVERHIDLTLADLRKQIPV